MKGIIRPEATVNRGGSREPLSSTTAHRFIAEGDHVVVEVRGNNTTKAGIPYNNTYCFVFRIADGRVKELTEYLDTELVTAALGDRC